MKIRVLTYGYNEIQMLPTKLAWCDYHGLEMVYFDNESTDGSKEWAIENGVFESDIITDGAFDIVTIINHIEAYRQDHQEEYDWSILAGVDTYLSLPSPQTFLEYMTIPEIEGQVTGIRGRGVNICRVKGETPINIKSYKRCTEPRDVLFIARSGCKIDIDNIICDYGITIKPLNLWWFNFGNTKPSEERKETYERRKLAWERGLMQGYGSHYRTLKSFNYTLPESMTESIESIGAKKSYEDLCDLLGKL